MSEELRGWKAICSYLGTSERTAQRWERELALPVRRAEGVAKGPVFAVPAELDAWRLSAHGIAALSGDQPGPQAPLAEAHLARFPARRRILWLAAAACLLVAGITAWLLFPRAAISARLPVPAPTGVPVEAHGVAASGAIVALDVAVADGTTFLLRIPDGMIGTLVVPGAPKLGLSPLIKGAEVRLAVFELTSGPRGDERASYVTNFPVSSTSATTFTHAGVSLRIRLRNASDTLAKPDASTAPSRSRCCIACDRIVACAAEVKAPCGHCCGVEFAGCQQGR
jgi:hypothetical protein